MTLRSSKDELAGATDIAEISPKVVEGTLRLQLISLITWPMSSEVGVP